MRPRRTSEFPAPVAEVPRADSAEWFLPLCRPPRGATEPGTGTSSAAPVRRRARTCQGTPPPFPATRRR